MFSVPVITSPSMTHVPPGRTVRARLTFQSSPHSVTVAPGATTRCAKPSAHSGRCGRVMLRAR